MPARKGLLLFIFSLIVSLGHHRRLAGLQAVPPDWVPATTLLGAFGLSALVVSLIGLVWKVLASGAEHAPEPEAHPTADLARSPQEAPDPSEDSDIAGLLRAGGLVDADWYIGIYPDVIAVG